MAFYEKSIMTLQNLLQKINTSPLSVEFGDVIEVINQHYEYTPTAFKNGLGNHSKLNEAGTNEGSCKIFSFGLLHRLDEQQTLHCFGDFYRKDVLEHPDQASHENIRNFIRDGWPGIQFDGEALKAKEF